MNKKLGPEESGWLVTLQRASRDPQFGADFTV
jgi:hypothetical protein